MDNQAVTIGQRIRQTRELRKMDRRELARRAGLSYTGLSDLELDRSKSTTKLHLIAQALSVDVMWLETGHGRRDLAVEQLLSRVAEQGNQDYTTSFLRPISIWHDPGDLPPDSTVFLPKLDYMLSAGTGGPDPAAVETTDKSLPFSASWAKSNGWRPQTHFTMRAHGESMEPTIQHNAPVVVDCSPTGKVLRSGSVYALVMDGEPLLKRLDKLPGGRLRIRSDNPSPAYASFEVDAAQVEIIGRAVWTPTCL